MNAEDQHTLRCAFDAVAAVGDILITTAHAKGATRGTLDYATTKWLGERLVEASDDIVCILRAADPACDL